jgi:hypothetical protein
MKPWSSLPFLGRFSTARSVLLVLLLIVLLFAIVLPLREGLRIRDQVAQARRQLADLKVLYPLYSEIMTMEKPGQWPSLQARERTPLKETEVVDMPPRILALAARASVELSTVSPRVTSNEDGTRWLAVEIRALAPYDNLRHFLLGLVQSPPMQSFERIELRRDFGREQAHIIVRLDLE